MERASPVAPTPSYTLVRTAEAEALPPTPRQIRPCTHDLLLSKTRIHRHSLRFRWPCAINTSFSIKSLFSMLNFASLCIDLVEEGTCTMVAVAVMCSGNDVRRRRCAMASMCDGDDDEVRYMVATMACDGGGDAREVCSK
ncbi:unnamed protein product [Cuscuta europaea]|uniref:Uncharacterized protein n=1 Tax=Cuscuta europaea TaxID=41803 RepID=A0A9P0ZRD4_CUSEU|nr:unnamed protein product [Cuscuta europaea]